MYISDLLPEFKNIKYGKLCGYLPEALQGGTRTKDICLRNMQHLDEYIQKSLGFQQLYPFFLSPSPTSS